MNQDDWKIYSELRPYVLQYAVCGHKDCYNQMPDVIVTRFDEYLNSTYIGSWVVCASHVEEFIEAWHTYQVDAHKLFHSRFFERRGIYREIR